jgi:hypothetical protein
MKDQHYSMKDPSDWTNEDMEMYKRDEARIEPDFDPYTEEQIKQIEQQLDYEETMRNKEQQEEWDRLLGQCLPLIIREMLRHCPTGDSLPIEILQYVEEMAEKVQARQLMPTASGARQVLDYPESKPLPTLPVIPLPF